MGPDEKLQRQQLGVLAFALVLAMSTWFSTAAVIGQLRDNWGLTRTTSSWLTIVVQLGFVAGAVLSSLTNLADRVPPRRLMLFGAVGAATANASIVIFDSYGPALGSRFLTGAFLAAVYPPALKAMSTWYRTNRGFALGVMVGALTLGSALPHLLNSIGSVDWEHTLLLTSALTLGGGLTAELLGQDGPHGVASAPFDPTQLKSIISNREFKLASIGYFGHMWELYAMWAWIASFYSDVFGSARSASLAAFAVIAAGAGGSVYAGLMSDRRSRPEAAALAMRWSAAVAAAVGFLVDAPWPLVLGLGLIWGFWVVADSAQFSTIVTEVTPAAYVGTALTIQLAAGFVLTVFTIFLVPVLVDAGGPHKFGWGLAFLLLTPGPILGAIAMKMLEPNQQPGSVSAR